MPKEFNFNSMESMEDNAIQQSLREIESQDLAQALKNSGLGVRQAILRNMSERAGNYLLTDMERAEDDEEKIRQARDKIVKIILKKAVEGIIDLPV